MSKENIIIIGGGAAGLMAAKELSGKCNVTILEAGARLGGRIDSRQTRAGLIEAGAEFIHGNLPLTLQLLKEAAIPYLPVAGNFYRKEKGKWAEQHEIIEGWEDLIARMKKVKTDMTMHDFLERCYSGDEHTELRRHVKAYTEGFDIADINKVSIKSLYKEWSAEDEENYRIPSGYGSLIRYLQEQCEKNGCKILLNRLVKQIDWKKNEVIVCTADEQRYDGNKVIITVPSGVLQQAAGKASVNFTPPIDEYTRSFGQIGYGAVIKVVCYFRQRLWKDDTGFIFSGEIFPTWWTQLPDDRLVLTGWAGGPNARRLSDHSEEDILEKSFLSLASIFDKSLEEIKENIAGAFIYNWQQYPCSLGAYSYDMPGAEIIRELLNTPIDNTVFFAGEALYDGKSPGTVEAALVSGQQVAGKCKM